MENIITLPGINPPQEVITLVDDFLKDFAPAEVLHYGKIMVLCDEKSSAFYISCHLKAQEFVSKADFNATIDDEDEDELYKLNRDITENQPAFEIMKSDAEKGRTFEDIVIEYDKSYNSQFPLKIYGGQHRIKAIEEAVSIRPDTYHGFRIYFNLNKEQKVEIATINNTSIAVSSDLLDRMREQLLGTELRDFFQLIGLLKSGQDFSDKKDATTPTVRVARTFVVNYWKGRREQTLDFHSPIVCKSGNNDEDYLSLRTSIKWDDVDFIEAGQKFALLHEVQRLKVSGRKNDNLSQFSSKAISLAVVAGWAFAAGYYSADKNLLKILYSLTNNLGTTEDPLNAKALSEARLKGIDPDTYRGLGARISPDELGRMLEVFIVLVEKATEKKISKNLANAAIQSYEAKKAMHNAQKSLSKL